MKKNAILFARIRLTCLVLAVLLCLTWYFVQRSEGFSSIPRLESKGSFASFDQERVPRSRICSMIAEDGKLYLYYDLDGIINVYTSGGQFLYELQVCTLRNGRGRMALQGETLYVETPGHVIYVIQGQQCLESFKFVYTDYTNETPVGLRYKALEAVFDEPQSQSTSGKTFEISRSRASLYVKKEADEDFHRVDFLPHRNPMVSVIKGLLIFLYLLWLGANPANAERRPRPHDGRRLK